MKHISFKLAFMAVVLAFAGTTFTACEDDIEITNGTTNPWENVDGQFGAVRSAAGAKMGATLTTKNGESATGHVYFELSKVAEQDTKVTFKIDADALTAYNAANSTNYTAYEGATLSNNGEVTIPAGKRISDYIDVNIPAGKSGNAVAITATADNGVTISSNNSTYIYQVKSVTYPQHNKAIKNLCYIEVNNENPLNAGEYTLSNGEPFFDIVSIFAANINLDSDGKPYIYCNEQVTYVLHNADKIIRPLQEKGIKVHLSILGNHDDAGMRSLSEEGAKAFAKELKYYVDIYGLDGIDFDDEYSSYAEGSFKGSAQSGTGVVASTAECTPQNYTNLLKACREELPKENGTAFGIYWYTYSDHPLGTEVESLIDYTVFGSYGSFMEYTGQDIDNTIEAPYAITLIADNNGSPVVVPVSESNLQKVKDNGYGYMAFYNLKSSKLYTSTFNQVASILWDDTVEWTGNTYARTETSPVQYSKPSYEEWLGTWTVKASGSSLYYYEAGPWWDWTNSKEFTVTITEGDEENTYKVYGWENYSSKVKAITDQYPFIAQYNEDGTIFIDGEEAVVGTPATGENAGNYILTVGTYGRGNNWSVTSTYASGKYILEKAPNGAVQMYYYSSSPLNGRYGFGLFKVNDDETTTAVMDITEAHSAGHVYTFSR